MQKLGTVVAALGLAVAGLTVPATTVQADEVNTRAAGCAATWPGRDGYVRAFRDVDCGTLLGATQGNDADWADGSGAFTGSDNNNASSVMNSGFLGGRDVVAFYLYAGYKYQSGYGCLAPGELYADWLGDNYYYGVIPPTTMENSISSHQWVTAGGCAGDHWID